MSVCKCTDIFVFVFCTRKVTNFTIYFNLCYFPLKKAVNSRSKFVLGNKNKLVVYFDSYQLHFRQTKRHLRAEYFVCHAFLPISLLTIDVSGREEPGLSDFQILIQHSVNIILRRKVFHDSRHPRKATESCTCVP